MSGYRPLTFTEDGLVRTFQQMQHRIEQLERRGVPVINIPEQECCPPVQSAGGMMWVDSRSATGTTSSVTLEAGVHYTLRITGNFHQFTGSEPVTDGAKDTLMFPSPGESSTDGATSDWDTRYATFATGSALGHRGSSLIDLGSGPQHIEPVGGPYATPTDGHVYLIHVTGQGSPVTVGPVEAGSEADNNGQFRVEIFEGWTNGEGLLSGIGDVDTTTNPPSDGDGLVYDEDTGTWVPGAGTTALSDLHSVEIVDDALHWMVNPSGSPQAVWDAETGRTWVALLKTGGDLYATYYDHEAGTVATPVLVAAYPFSAADFHNVPALMLDADGRLHIILGDHGDEGHRHYRMTNPRDLSAWTVQTLDTGTYPFAAVTDDGELIFTDRPAALHGSSFPAHEYGAMHRSTDGTTWTRTEIVDTTGTPESHSDFYQTDLLWADGALHMIWTVARGSAHDDIRTSAYYASFDPATGVWSAADGTSLGTTITWADHTSCLVKSHADASNPRMSLAWFQGRPAIATWFSDASGAVLSVHLWTGSAWAETEITTRGTNEVPLLHATPDELVLMTRADGLPMASWRYFDGIWEPAGSVLSEYDGFGYGHVTPVRGGGPAVGLTLRTPDGWAASDDTVTGRLILITRRYEPGEGVDQAAIDAAVAAHNADATAHPDLQVDLPNETVFAPAYTVTDATALDVAVTFVWGVDATSEPYYNAAGVTAGEEAVLVLDNTTGEFSLRPVEV